MSDDKVLKRRMWPNKEEVLEDCRKWQNLKFHNLYDSLNITIIIIIKSEVFHQKTDVCVCVCVYIPNNKVPYDRQTWTTEMMKLKLLN